MKTQIILSLLVILMSTACNPTSTPTPTPMPAGCVDFSGYPDNTTFGNPFTLNGYQFTGLGAGPFVNVSGSVVGLQFTDAGLEIDLPGPTSAVDLDVASFTSRPLTIAALDSSGGVVANATVPGDNAVHSLTLSGANIVKVMITGGGNEGVLVKICSKSSSAVCVDFEPPLALGTQYGTPAGQNPGDLAFTANGIPVTVWDFNFTSGGGTFNLASIDAAPVPFGSGQSIRSNNINLEFDFSGLGFTPSQIQFEFLDLGGFENIAVNGSPVFAGELSTTPNPIGGISYNIVKTPVSGGSTGTMTLTGAVQRLRIGGQEFWIDNVCASK